MKTKGAGELKWTLGERRPLLEEGFGSEKMNGSKVSGSCRGVGNGGYAACLLCTNRWVMYPALISSVDSTCTFYLPHSADCK